MSPGRSCWTQRNSFGGIVATSSLRKWSLAFRRKCSCGEAPPGAPGGGGVRAGAGGRRPGRLWNLNSFPVGWITGRKAALGDGNLGGLTASSRVWRCRGWRAGRGREGERGRAGSCSVDGPCIWLMMVIK